ncbi:MAG: protein translocase subunit SecF [Gemmatimonadaceae bacterium]
MLRILHDTKYDFIRLRRYSYAISAAIILIGAILVAVGGYRYSVEFTGGTLTQLHFKQPPNVSDIRSALDGGGVPNAEVQQFGDANTYVVRAQSRAAIAQQQRGASSVDSLITQAMTKRFGAGAYEVARSEAVGPKVGGELRWKAFEAMLLSFVVVLIYLAIRFEWRFGVAAVAATAHDFLTTLAFIKFFNLEISLVVVGAILTMIGYSLNDTIIIFDRVRENLRKRRKESLYDTLNRSVNETLPRSILTHATVAATLIGLIALGGQVIRPFAWIMLFGVFTGTLSSIYIAAPVLLWIETKWPRAVGDKGGVGPRARVAGPETAPPGGSRGSKPKPATPVPASARNR